MSKSPLKDYTTILQQSRTKKKQENYSSTYHQNYERPSYQSRRDYESSNNRKYESSSNKYTSPSDDLQMKLQLSLKHNTRLLDENSSLSELTSQLRFQLQNVQDDINMLRVHGEDQLRATAKERETLIMENQIKQSTHDQELKRLLDEVSTLHEEKNNLEIQKNKQIENVKGEFEKNLLTQMQSIRNIQANTKQIYETQISSLKETITRQDYEMDNLRAVEKLERNRLNDQIAAMNKQTLHMKSTFEIQLREAKREFQNSVHSEKRRNQHEREIEDNAFNLKIKRLKKELLDKAEDLEMVNKKMYQQEETNQLESLHYRKDKENLLAELTNNEINSKTVLMKEKTKLEELTRLEIDNLTQLYETNIEQLQGEVNRLRLLIDCKTEEIKDIYEENRKIKDSYNSENQILQNQNDNLKQSIRAQEKLFREEEQATKVKLTQLIETNIKQLSSYFEHELSNISLHNRDLQNLNKDLKERIYKLLQENDEIRKNFEIESSKYRARIQDLKIKLASINLEHKEHIGSLSSKVELTSQTIIRDSENKDRSKAFYDEEKRKFHSLASQKDKQITDLMEMLKNVKVMHEDELKVTRAEKDGYREEIQRLEQDKLRIKQSLEQQLINKEEKLKNLKYDNQKEIDEINELEKTIDTVEKQNIKLKKQVDHLTMTYNAVATELGLSKGHIESIMLESNANIEEEKNKIRMLMGTHEVTLKEYYEDKVKGKNSQIDNLERTLKEKEEDIRDLIVKYNALEKRLTMVMENQEKLTDFEEKVKKLGLDDSLIKGMAELFMKKGAANK